MVQLTPVAVTKVKEILTQQNPSPVGLRVAVVGGGCSGFSYHMAFENQRQRKQRQRLRIRRPQSSRRSDERDVPRRRPSRLHRDHRRFGLQVQQPEREEHLRLRQLLQRLSSASQRSREALSMRADFPLQNFQGSQDSTPESPFFVRAAFEFSLCVMALAMT